MPSFIESGFTTRVEYEKAMASGVATSASPVDVMTRPLTKPPAVPPKIKNLGYTIDTDPRLDKKQASMFSSIGLGGMPSLPPETWTDATTREEILAFSLPVEEGFSAVFAAVPQPKLPIELVHTTEIITGVDGNDITLYITKPKDAEDVLPCVYHSHGGAMAFLHAADSAATSYRERLASEGLCVIGVEFRNCAGKDGLNVFPAGLNDCSSGLYWVAENRAKLGIGKIILNGESGGGNLAIATMMKAKQDGRLDALDGCYALCPYIAGALNYATPPAYLSSLIENNNVFLAMEMLTPFAKIYTDDKDANNPLAWPLYATKKELEGLPPVLISVNECDPLRDEGMVFGKKLSEAGNDTSTVCIMGTPHAGDVVVPGAHMDNTMRNISAFAKSL